MCFLYYYLVVVVFMYSNLFCLASILNKTVMKFGPQKYHDKCNYRHFIILQTMPNAFEMTEEEGCQLFKKGPCVPCL